MQCPECSYTPAAGETFDPAKCPSCGAYYHKSFQRKLLQAEALNQQQADELRKAQSVHEIRGQYIEELKKNSAPVMSYQVKEALGEYQGATPVVVLDLRMSFFSMVWFMVKWAFASIPAIIIVVMMLMVVGALFGGVGGIFRNF